MRHLLILSLFACSPAGKVVTSPLPETPVSLTVIAINDFHGALYETPSKFEGGNALGGLPVLVGALELLRSEDPELLLLDGGDEFQGAWPVNASQGMGSVHAFNLLKVDAAAVGNHEFDYGGVEGGHPLRGALKAAAREANYPFLAANIYDAEGERWTPEGVEPWTMIERKGVKIGIIGLATEDTPQTTLLRNVEDLRFDDVVQTVQIAAPKLRAQGAHVIMAVGHLSGACETPSYTVPPEPCLPNGEIGRLLTELPPGTLDVLVAGHAHTLLAHRWDNTFLLENRTKGQMLGRLDLVVGPDGVDHDASTIHPPWVLDHAPIDPGCAEGEYPLDPLEVGGRLVTPSADALALVQRLEAESGSLCDPLGCATQNLGRDRQRESEVGNLVSDAMFAAFEDVDLAVTNSGGLRADIPAGTIRREHIHGVMPFDNELLLVEMNGAQVQTMFRLGSSGAHGILQLAGGDYHFDPERTEGTDLDGNGEIEGWETVRLCDARIDGAPLDPERMYRVVTTDFLYDGGDHMTLAFEGVPVLERGPLLRDAIVDYHHQFEACVDADGPLMDPTAPRIRAAPCE